MKFIALYLIDAYQRWGGGERLLVDCNFDPTCSEYAREAIQKHGVVKGMKYVSSRLRRCNDRDKLAPDFDPVPEE